MRTAAILILLITLTCSGCIGDKREVRIVFTGEDVIARVATNERVPLVVRKGNETYFQRRDIGQAVVMPLWRYRALLKKAKGGK